MVDYASEKGIPASVVLRGSDLPVGRVADPELEIAAAQELQVAANLVEAFGAPTLLGTRVGRRYRLSTYGIWGYGLIVSATLGHAFAMALRFLPLTYVFAAIHQREEGPLQILTFDEPDLGADLRAFLVARDMAAAVTLGRELVGSEFVVAGAALGAPEIAPAEREIGRVFGVEPRLDAGRNELAIPRACLAMPLAQANAITAATCETICRDLLAARHAAPSVSTVLRNHLRFIGDGRYRLDSSARFLNMSERSLKRRLREEGTTFTDIVRDIRLEAACALLQDDDVSVAEIGNRLGFSDASSFSQAFKRWAGSAPAIFRRNGLPSPGMG